jgi:NAD(P)-dependent dehydrogenase (short-subunit alcohol dehydrogenase family)
VEELAGKVAVVTGGASGIGLGLTRAFLDQGMRVVIGDIEEPALDKAVADLGAEADVLPVVTDVSRIEDVERLRDQALDTYGSVDLVCNNAGVAAGGLGWEVSLDDWQWVLGVNLWGVVHGVKTFLPLLVEQGHGHVVNTASMAGLLSSPFMAPYNVAKHGVVTLSETLFAELSMMASPVGVSVLCPGWVDTHIGEADRNRPGARPDVEPTEESAATRALLGSMLANGLPPSEVAALVIDAVKANRFYVFTHPEWMPVAERRFERIVTGEPPEIDVFPT